MCGSRSLIAARDLESDAVRDVGPVYRACERLRPLLEWLAGHAAEVTQARTVPPSTVRIVPVENDWVRQYR
jgi:hypothetical protein